MSESRRVDPAGAHVIASTSGLTMDDSNEQLRQLVVPLFAIAKSAEWHAIGTSFVVAALGRHALLVTAGHNIDYFRRLVFPPSRQHPSLPSFIAPRTVSKIDFDGTELVALVRKRGQNHIAICSHTSQIRGADIALLSVSLPEGTHCDFERAFAIDSTPIMPIGLPLTGFGYIGLMARSEQDYTNDIYTAVADEGTLVSRTGKLLSNVEAGGRNRFTGMYVSSPFDSGMSGGPVIELRNDEPFVRGVITSDLSDDRSNQSAGTGARAFASSIWMLAGLRAFGTNLEREDGTLEANPLVRDLIAKSKIRDQGSAHKYVQVIEDIEGDERKVKSLTWTNVGSERDVPQEVSTMSQPASVSFVSKEIIAILLKNQDIHEGHWSMVVKFTTTATNIALNGGDTLPTVVAQVSEIGLQLVDEQMIGSVDASSVNPRPANTDRA